jgi:hypothetical protein
VVDINITRICPGLSIVWAVPLAASDGASRVGHDIRSISCENSFSRIACTRYSDPVRKFGSRVAGLQTMDCDFQSGELSGGGAGRWNAWGGGVDMRGKQSEKRIY